MSTPEAPTTTTTSAAPSGLALYKPGQGTVSRWIAYILLGILLVMGVRSLFGALFREGHDALVPGLPIVGDLTWLKVICAFVFVFGAWGIHKLLNRPAAVDLLIDTEQELKKVSWPSWAEVKSATLVVTIVTVVMGAILFWADELLQALFRFVIG
jgi:preprotein translocase SecE subunit